jgi:hypothetical protein
MNIRKAGRKSEAFLDLITHFIAPFGKAFLKKFDNEEALDAFFHVNTRTVFSARIKEDCNLPGYEELPGGRLRKVRHDRRLRTGTRVLVCLDNVQKLARIELENQKVYLLKEYEWNYVKGRLDQIGKAGFDDNARIRS